MGANPIRAVASGGIVLSLPSGATTMPGDRFTYTVVHDAPKPTGNRLARRTAAATASRIKHVVTSHTIDITKAREWNAMLDGPRASVRVEV